ncbi:MAG: biotin--[acetyl-CoA-carboxylase] ligase [Candidatus Omnitrophota bacterium]|nr:biotin--[acetyl-CoA-carboxylase] ligase [Candidatus Omnitrophota bacterium]MBU1929707.1 biotin--[acetyl-CoA-carboxylase] ligase [Candidatus Omnitrophota bacterium]MBU2035105.1 biotin--[acetyl-CoA-carboxylase] ligase [Candidatus Omnitrophota bacterium]
MQDKILDFLKLKQDISGAHPERLSSAGVTHQLHTKFIGRKVYYFQKVVSTMDVAMQWVTKGACEGALVLAETQTKGRGRLGRFWSSPKYKGLYFSLILKPKILPSEASIFTLMAAVSICEAIKETTELEPQIKWPNDILIQNKKVGGILTELDAEMDEVRFLVIGIGLNVNNDKAGIVLGATSLKEQKKEEINRLSLLQEILRRIEDNYLVFQKEGPRPVLKKWRDFNITLGKRVKVNFHKKHIEGVAVDIDVDGALLVRDNPGLIHRFTAGDVTLCR